jgi:flavin-dependent dehydrogenase
LPSFRLGVQLFKKEISDEVEIWPLRNGFCWKIPKGEYLEYGALGNKDSLKKDFENFCLSQGISFDWKEVKSALVPQGLVFSEDKNVALCGDALGLTKPWSGGGIIWGFKAADILLDSFPDFKEYRKRVSGFFKIKIIKGKLISNITHFIGNNFSFLLPKEILRDNDFPFL